MGKKKKILKSIESFKKQIEEHKRKVKEYGGKNYALLNYWEKEIKVREEQMEREKEKLEKK